MPPPLCLFGIPLGFSLRKRRELRDSSNLAFSSVGSNFCSVDCVFYSAEGKGFVEWAGRDVRLLRLNLLKAGM